MRPEFENIRRLNILAWPYKEKRESGLLSVKVEGYEHLVKIYFELGTVVGLSMGNMKNESCLDVLTRCNPLGSSFIKGYKVPDSAVAEKDAAARLEELFALYPVTGAKTAGESAPAVSVSADNILKLEKDFIEIIGPIGRMFIDAFYSEYGYRRGQDMPAPLYSQLFETLRTELPDQYQPAFAAKNAIGAVLNRNSNG
jgi:hypothetical protein